MRKATWILTILLIPGLLLAHGNKPGKATLPAGDGAIEIVFTAPELKGRNIDELIKMPGANPWRMGADRSTVLTTPVALEVDGGTIPAGEYTLRAFLDDSDMWWLQFVEDETVAGKVALQSSMAGQSEEHLVIALSGSAASANIKIQWGTKLLTGSFSAD